VWSWFAGMLGEVKWSYHKVPDVIYDRRMTGSMCSWLNHTVDLLLTSEPVDVLLFDLVWNNLTDVINYDSQKRLKLIMWLSVNKRRFDNKVPSGWTVSWHKVEHSKLGGVSVGVFVVGVCRRLPIQDLEF